MFKNIVLLILAGLFLGFGEAMSQTPDSETPAQEGVCDELHDASPGLYGLCVAFCEAQDLDDMIAIVEDGGMPGAKILERYNAKMRDGDPDMPCIVSAPQCPCFVKTLCAGGICNLDIASVDEIFLGFTCDITDRCTNYDDEYGQGANDTCQSSGIDDGSQAFAIVPPTTNEAGLCGAIDPTGAFNRVILDQATAQLCLDELNAFDGNTAADGRVSPCGLGDL